VIFDNQIIYHIKNTNKNMIIVDIIILELTLLDIYKINQIKAWINDFSISLNLQN
jgi:hypothetical protein